MASTNKTLSSITINKRRNWFYAGFILINLFLSCYYLDVWLTPNAASRALPVLTLYEDKTLVIDKYKNYTPDISLINNHYYSNKAPATSLVVYPFYWLYKSIGLPELSEQTLKKYPVYIYDINQPNIDARSQFLPNSYTVLILGDILCGAIPFVIILILSLFAIKKTSSKVSPVAVVMLSFYSSFIFAYASTFNSHILSGFLALSGYILIKNKSYILSGLMVGLAMTIEFPIGILVPAWGLLIYLNEKKILKPVYFLAGLMPGLLIVMYFNYHLTGSISSTSYNYELFSQKQQARDIGFYFPSFSAFWGLVFSTYRGALYYTPVLIVMFWYVIKYGYQNTIKKVANKMELLNAGVKNYLLATILVYLLLYSSYYQWAGGWAFGPRYLIPVVIIVLYEGILFISSKSVSAYAFYLISGTGLLFAWMDKSTKIYQFPPNSAGTGNPFTDIIIPDFFKHRFNANTLPVFLFDFNPVTAIYLWPVLFIISLLILVKWHSGIYQTLKKKSSFYLPLSFLFVFCAFIFAAGHTLWKKNFTLDYSGPFGGYECNALATQYQDTAQNSKDTVKKKYFYKLAISEYKKGIQSSPIYYANYNSLGVCYQNEGYKDSAILAFKMALIVNPKLTDASNYLGVIYFNNRQYDSALHYFLMSYGADSNDLVALKNIGTSYMGENKFELAFHYDSLVLKKEPKDTMTLIRLSLMHNSLGMQLGGNKELDKAFEEFTIALKYDSNSADVLGNIGVIYAKKGDFKMVKRYYLKALSKKPGDETFIRNLKLLNGGNE